MLAAPVTALLLHVGQVRTFAHARPGDVALCRGGGDVLRVKIRPSTGSFAWDTTLSLTVTRVPHGGIRVRCSYR